MVGGDLGVVGGDVGIRDGGVALAGVHDARCEAWLDARGVGGIGIPHREAERHHRPIGEADQLRGALGVVANRTEIAGAEPERLRRDDGVLCGESSIDERDKGGFQIVGRSV